MKNPSWPVLLYAGICFLILGALLRLTFEVAWDAREEAIATHAIAAETRDQIYFLRGKAFTLERKIDSAAKFAQIYDRGREMSDSSLSDRLIELKRVTDEAEFQQRLRQDEALKRLGEGKK